MSNLTTKDTEGLFVVIPAFNEALVLNQVIEDVSEHVSRSNIIVVDDGSTDETANESARAGVTVLRHLVNRGQGAALATGIAAALRRQAKAIVTFDADGQHSAEDIPHLVEPVLTGQYDVVLGSRFIGTEPQEMPVLRRWILHLAVLFTRVFSQIQVTDVHNGLRAFSMQSAKQIRIHEDRMAHASELLDEIRRHRIRYVEHPVKVVYSPYSLSKGQKNIDAIKLALRILIHKVTG